MNQVLVESQRIEIFFVIFFTVLLSLEVVVNLTLRKFHGCKMTEKWPKISIDVLGHFSVILQP